MYDSRPDTQEHIARVRALLAQFGHNLHVRGVVHDCSKLESPEKEIFDEFTPKLKGSTYGSDEYKSFLAAMKPALDHHYAANRHHPEHFNNGIRGMSLFDIVEMFCDWKAATERHADGDIAKSIEINQKRFEYSDELKAIFENTRLEWFGDTRPVKAPAVDPLPAPLPAWLNGIKVFVCGPETWAARNKEELWTVFKEQYGIEGSEFESDCREVVADRKFLSKPVEIAGSKKYVTVFGIISEHVAKYGDQFQPFLVCSTEY